MITLAGASSSVDIASVAMEGIDRAMREAGRAAAGIASGEVTPENMIAQMSAVTQVKANAAVLKTADDMLGTLLDTFA